MKIKSLRLYYNKPKLGEYYSIYHGEPTKFTDKGYSIDKYYMFANGLIVFIDNWDVYIKNGLIKRITKS